MGNQKLFPGIIIVVLLALGGIVFWYVSQRERQELESGGVVETAKTVSDSVPEIQTNPAEDVPEINPLDRANPFKYTNPLR